MTRKGAILATALFLAFLPASSSAKTISYYYQPHFYPTIDDATNHLQFLSAHLYPGNRWGMPNAGSNNYTLNRVSQTTLGINFYFTVAGVEEKPVGLLGLTSTKEPFKRDFAVSIIYADLQSLIIWNIERTSSWCVVPVGGRAENNDVLCVPSFKDAQEFADSLATLAVAFGSDLRSNFGMMLRQTTAKEFGKHPEKAGCAVTSVDQGGPALLAGVDEDDIVRTVNGAPCTLEAMRSAISAAATKPQGGEVQVEILRKQGTMNRSIQFAHVDVDVAGLRQQAADATKPAAGSAATTAAAPAPATPAFHLGVSVRAMTDADLPGVVLPKVQGVLITKVEKDSLADEMQMQVGDAIIAVNGAEIADSNAFAQMVRGGAAKNFKVWRKGQAIELVVPESL